MKKTYAAVAEKISMTRARLMNEIKMANPDAQNAMACSLAVIELRLYSMTIGMTRSSTTKIHMDTRAA